MKYVMAVDGRRGLTLFLVDRKIYKKRWWTTDLDFAIQFRERTAAEIQSKKLKFKSPRVMDLDEAKRVNEFNSNITQYDDEHPFSSDSLGQW